MCVRELGRCKSCLSMQAEERLQGQPVVPDRQSQQAAHASVQGVHAAGHHRDGSGGVCGGPVQGAHSDLCHPLCMHGVLNAIPSALHILLSGHTQGVQAFTKWLIDEQQAIQYMVKPYAWEALRLAARRSLHGAEQVMKKLKDLQVMEKLRDRRKADLHILNDLLAAAQTKKDAVCA